MMGMFDTYGNVQLKVGDELYCQDFTIGDSVNIPDGVYLGYEGAVVIVGGVFVAEFGNLVTKWGSRVDIKPLVDPHSPVVKAIAEMGLKPTPEARDD